MKEISLKPIGFVKNNIKKPRFGNFGDEISEIIVDEKHKGNTIKVKGLDILDNTPIIDIKPYWTHYDKVVGEKIPDWVNKLQL